MIAPEFALVWYSVFLVLCAFTLYVAFLATLHFDSGLVLPQAYRPPTNWDTMERVKARLRAVKEFFKTDWSILRARRLVRRGVKKAPGGVARYLLNKIPVAQWIPMYNYKWLPSDVLAGVTVGIVLVLQAVNLAFPINGPGAVPISLTVIACWLPGFIYAITGTSKRTHIHLSTDSSFHCAQTNNWSTHRHKRGADLVVVGVHPAARRRH